MKKLYISVLALVIGVNISAQVTTADINQFYENQKTPFLKGNGETFVLNGTSWERLYGEKEYVLTPVAKDMHTYIHRIEKMNNINPNKSIFHYVKVKITQQSKSELGKINIYVPNYIHNFVNAYLPQIDLDKLTQQNINFSYLSDYGKTLMPKIKNPNDKTTIIYSEGFETNTVPGSVYSTGVVTGAVNCGWGDESCSAHSGFWSVWCSKTCDAACNSYSNNMDAWLTTTNRINTTGYQDLWFKYWLNYDMYNIGTNDVLYYYHAVDNASSLVLDATYNSSSPNDGLGYNHYLWFFSGVYTNLVYQFEFTSNSVGTSNGVYIDDIELSGTPTVGIDELNLDESIGIYPNPTKGIFTVEGKNINHIEISTISGQIIKTITVNNNETSINLSNQPKGIYFVKVVTKEGSITKKVLLQ